MTDDRLLVDSALKAGRVCERCGQKLHSDARVGDCYTIPEVMKMLKCSRTTLLTLRKEAGLPWFEVEGGRGNNGMVRIPALAFEKWFAERVRRCFDDPT